MKRTISTFLVTMLVIFTLTAFCACGNNNDGKTADNKGSMMDDAKDIIDDGDLDLNNQPNNGSTNSNKDDTIKSDTDNTTTSNGTTTNDTTGIMTDDTK